MFTSWAVAPKANPEDKEYFTSEFHAVDVAYDWSIDAHGDAMIVFCNDQQWMEITAWFETLRGSNPPPILYSNIMALGVTIRYQSPYNSCEWREQTFATFKEADRMAAFYRSCGSPAEIVTVNLPNSDKWHTIPPAFVSNYLQRELQN